MTLTSGTAIASSSMQLLPEQRELLEFQLQEFKLNEEAKLGLDDHPNISLVTGITA